MAYSIGKTKKLQKLPKWEQFIVKNFPEDTTKTFRKIYGLEKRERKVGTIVDFGRGEMKTGIITKVEPEGVWVQEFEFTGNLGYKTIGTPRFIHKERFERHLGMFGAVGTEVTLF